MFSGCAQLDNGRGGDWLVDDIDKKVTIAESADSREIVMDNGLIRRVFRLGPNVATVAFDNLMTGESMLRAVPIAGKRMLSKRAIMAITTNNSISVNLPLSFTRNFL
jgi:hypothetical protein